MNQTELKHAARKQCMVEGQHTYGGRGRTDGPTYACWHTPVTIIPDSGASPIVKGLGYWKTGYGNGKGFSTTLYTPSTFHIVVGENWYLED